MLIRNHQNIAALVFVVISSVSISNSIASFVDGQNTDSLILKQYAFTRASPGTNCLLRSAVGELHGLRGGDNRQKHLELKSPITYITDCKDENGKGRLKARLATLFPGHSVAFVGVSSDYEAAINLVRIPTVHGSDRPEVSLF